MKILNYRLPNNAISIYVYLEQMFRYKFFVDFKGTVSRDFLACFFIKLLLLVHLYLTRRDFEFFRMFKELFAFVIDSLMYSPPGSRESLMYSPPPWNRDSSVYSPGKRDSPVMNRVHYGVDLNWFPKTSWCKIHQRDKTPYDWYTGESLFPGLFATRKFCCKPVLMLVPITPISWLSGLFTTGQSRLPGVFFTRKLFWTLGSHFTNFKEHTTSFKGTI